MSVNKLRRWKGLAVMAIVVLGIVLAASSPSQARKEGGGGHPGGWFAHHDVHDHFGHERAGFGFGGALPYYPYYGYYPYYPPYDPIAYGYQAPVYWYYCPSYGACYPSVTSCPQTWVPALAS